MEEEKKEPKRKSRRTNEEMLAEVERKQKELAARKRQLQSRIDGEERKKRNHALIQIGAEFDKVFVLDYDHIDVETIAGLISHNVDAFSDILGWPIKGGGGDAF